LVSSKQFKKIKIQIKNVDVTIAGSITHYLYDMVDNQELQSVSIDDVRKSKNSIEIVLGAVGVFLIGYTAGKALDIPYYHAVSKIRSMLQKWKKKSKHGTLDFFMDDEPIE